MVETFVVIGFSFFKNAFVKAIIVFLADFGTLRIGNMFNFNVLQFLER